MADRKHITTFMKARLHFVASSFIPSVAPVFPLLVLAGYSLLFYLQGQEGAADSTGLWHSVAYVMLVTGLSWFVIHLLLCLAGPAGTRRATRISLCISLVLYVVAILVIENLFQTRNNVPKKYVLGLKGYTEIQKNLILQLKKPFSASQHSQ